MSTSSGATPPAFAIDPNKAILFAIFGVVALIVLGAYAYVVVTAGLDSLKSADEPPIPKALTGVTTGVGSALATNLGAFLGITAATLGTISLDTLKRTLRFPTVQAVAALFYVAMLVVALVLWGLDGWSEKTAEIIRSHTATLFGVGVGALAVILNVKLK